VRPADCREFYLLTGGLSIIQPGPLQGVRSIHVDDQTLRVGEFAHPCNRIIRYAPSVIGGDPGCIDFAIRTRDPLQRKKGGKATWT
jgi:hypothetical protein